ncbi:MAG: tRNA pseudouridine(13) synthase TruD [archaeon]
MYIIKQIPEDFIVQEISGIEIKERGRFAYYALKKRKYTTERAIKAVALELRLQRKQISYAGAKDKDAVTVQTISIAGKGRELKQKELELKFLGFGDTPVSLGCLKGNRFAITVRNMASAKISRVARIPNYFDEQRFSANNVGIGKAILEQRFDKAVELILQGRGENERRVMSNLAGNNYIQAMRTVPKNTLLMYIHSVQSYIFNETLSGFLANPQAKRVKYSLGEFVFPDPLPKAEKIPLIGFGTELEGLSPRIGQAIQRTLTRNGIHLRDFIIRKIPMLSSEGDDRDIYAAVRDLRIGKPKPDDLNTGKYKVTLSFELQKGSYATIVLRAMLPN